MDNIFVNAGIIALIYLIIKFAEMRLVNKEAKPLKELIRDMLIVYVSVLSGLYVIDELVVSQNSKIKYETTNVFIDPPTF
jgi:hypothetical protein